MVRVWSNEEQVANRDRFWSMVGSGASVSAACEWTWAESIVRFYLRV